MKKTIFLIFIGSVAAGAALLCGVSYAFGAIAEAGVRNTARTQPDDGAEISWQFDLGDYRRGFFSSETHSRFHLESETGAADEDDGDVGSVARGTGGGAVKTAEATRSGTPLRHVIYHGPVAMTPEGPKFCSYHVVTTLRRDQMNETGKKNVEKAFGKSEPITIHTTTAFGGGQRTRIEVASFSLDDDDLGSMKFEGATGTLDTGPNLAFARGDFKIGALTGEDDKLGGTRFEVAPSKGTLDYVKGKKLLATFKTGNIAGEFAGHSTKVAPSEGRIDWLKGQHLKANLTLGTMEAADDAGSGPVTLGPGTATVDFRRVSDTFDLLLGEAKIGLDKVEINSEIQRISMEDIVLRFSSGEDRGKLFGILEYGVGQVRMPEPPGGAAASASPPLGDAMGKGLKMKLGLQGLDLGTVENLVAQGRELAEIENITALSDLSDSDPDFDAKSEVSDRLGAALAENSEAVTEFSRQILDLFQPGLDFFYTFELLGEVGKSDVDLRIGLGGERKLTEMKTAREMLAAVKGKVIVRADKQQFPPELVEAMISDSPLADLIVENPDGFEAFAELKEGTAYINGEATPILDDLGPALDEEFDWDTFFEGMAAGIGEAAAE